MTAKALADIPDCCLGAFRRKSTCVRHHLSNLWKLTDIVDDLDAKLGRAVAALRKAVSDEHAPVTVGRSYSWHRRSDIACQQFYADIAAVLAEHKHCTCVKADEYCGAAACDGEAVPSFIDPQGQHQDGCTCVECVQG